MCNHIQKIYRVWFLTKSVILLPQKKKKKKNGDKQVMIEDAKNLGEEIKSNEQFQKSNPKRVDKFTIFSK